jgi:CDP-diacylglycerol--glycerol-3-phosphate 3-phosphatidyltransferase
MSERELGFPASIPAAGRWQQAATLSGCLLTALVGTLAALSGLPARFLVGVVLGFGLQTLVFVSAEQTTQPRARFLTIPTVVTVLRGSVAVALAGFLFVSPPGGLGAWVPALLYGGVASLDALDGFLARATGATSAYGSRLDAETDALAVLLATAVAVHLGRAPVVFVLAGVARYGFVAAVWVRQARGHPTQRLQSRISRRAIAATTMVGTFVVLWPAAPSTVSGFVALSVTAVLLAGFARDWLLVTDRL